MIKKILLLITLFVSVLSWGQGSETFTNSNATGSYSDGSYVGDNGVTWNYTQSRNDGTYQITGAGLMLRRLSDNSKVVSSSVSGGIGNFTCKLLKAFTGTGNRQVELFINGTSQGTSVLWDNTSVQTFTVNNINISGNIVVEIRNKTSNQVTVDDITWTAYSALPSPEIDLQGNAVSIVTGDASPSLTDDTDFGSVTTAAGTIVKTYTIQNTGTGALTVGAITISGVNASDFTVTTSPASSVAANSSTTFQVTFNPSADGMRNATINIVNNDSDENPYTFSVLGNGISAPVITSSLTASGNQGGTFIYSITATNSPTSFNATGLPAGLSINITTGVVSGTPTVSGSYNITVTATNGVGSDNQTLVITLGTGPCLSDNFNSGYGSWSGGSGTYNNSAAGATGNGIGFNDANDDIITTVALTNPLNITFNGKASGATSSFTIKIQYSTSAAGPWTDISSIVANGSNSGNITNTNNAFNIALGLTGNYFLRIIQQPRSSGSFYLDDVEVFCGASCIPPSNPTGVISGTTPACETTTLSFSGLASAPIEYYWQSTSLGTDLSNNANSNLTVISSGNYFVRAYNPVTSCWSAGEVGPYNITINNNPTIVTQPVNTVVIENGNTTISVTTTGSGLSYQWQVNTGGGFVNLSDSVPYSNVTSTTLNITTASQTMNGYQFQCIVSGSTPCTNVISNLVTLSVNSALGTVFKPGELVFVGYDGQVNGSGSDDEYLVATLVDIEPETQFSIVNSRYEAGAPANVRTDKWGGGSDTAASAPFQAVIVYHGPTAIPAGSVLRIVTAGTSSWFGLIEVITGVTSTNRTSDFTGSQLGGDPNISTGGSDQMYLLQGSFVFDGTNDANEANYILSGTLLHGLTNRANWVPITNACNGGSSGGNTRESRLPSALTCFNVESIGSSSISGYYHNDKQHGLATLRQIIGAIGNVSSNWTLSNGRYTVDPSSNSISSAGKTFQIAAGNPIGQWVGDVDNNWFNCANWEGLAVPKSTTDVTVSSSAINTASISFTAPYSDEFQDIAKAANLLINGSQVKLEGSSNNILEVHGNLTIDGTGVFDMSDGNNATSDGTLHLFGNWSNLLNEVAFDQGNGTVYFDGGTPQIISSSDAIGTEVFYNVILNNNFDTSVSNNLIAQGDLTVNSSKLLTVQPNDYVQVNNKLQLNGNIVIENNGQLIQVNETDTNSGTYTGTNFQVKRTAQARNLDYVYWSSPVENFDVSNLPNSHRYYWNTTAINANSTEGNWLTASGIMDKGKGYIARASNGSSTAITVPVNFQGKPFNGQFNYSISRGSTVGTDDCWNLVGNPYPSAIDAESFLVDNTNIEGSVRIWTHGILPAMIVSPFYQNFQYNYSDNDYIVYNKTATSKPSTFNGKIASGQGFFIRMLENGETDVLPPASEIIPLTANIMFKNEYRSDAISNILYDNSNFYRTNNSVTSEEKSRIWLDLISTNNLISSTVIGYVPGATLAKDRLYDALIEVDAFKIYSLIGTQKQTIQGRPIPFDANDIVPLGTFIQIAGNYTIAISAVDGLFTDASQNIYLEDKLLNTIHDLKQSPYTFSTTVGEFNNRFVLRYTDRVLNYEQFENTNDLIIVAKNEVSLSASESIKSVVVFDVLGRKIYIKNNINSTEVVLENLTKSKEALIVKTTFESGKIITKKILF